MFGIHPQIEQKAFRLGKEQTPIFVIDHFMQDYSGAIEEAIKLCYSDNKEQVGAYYPGVRAPVGADYGMSVLMHCQDIFYHFFSFYRTFAHKLCWFFI